MKITNVKPVTRVYVSSKGNRFALIRFDIEDNTTDIAHNETNKYGTVDYKYIDGNGMLKPGVRLLELHRADTVSEAIRLRELAEEISGMTDEELFEFIKNKRAMGL